MRRRTKILLFLGVLAVLGGGVAWQWERVVGMGDSALRAYVLHFVRSETTALPRCDRVEVFRLDGDTLSESETVPFKPGEGFPIRAYGKGEAKVLGHVTLTGTEAEAFAALWRAQKFDYGLQKLCHSPVCGFRFYSGRQLLFETSVCFHCSNFYVTVPLLGSGWWGFDAESPQARDLAQQVQAFFPDTKPKEQ